MSSKGKNIHKPVLVNPHSLDWRIFGQNPDVCLPCFLESCRTAGALVEPNLCGYVCYVVEKPLCHLKEKYKSTRFGELSFSQLSYFQPKPSCVSTLFSRKLSYRWCISRAKSM
jgi:hypothetical protein